MRDRHELRSDLRGAAVDEQLDAGDKATVVRGEEDRGLRNFVRRAQTTQRYASTQCAVRDQRQRLLQVNNSPLTLVSNVWSKCSSVISPSGAIPAVPSH
jgi:hypothetical protein